MCTFYTFHLSYNFHNRPTYSKGLLFLAAIAFAGATSAQDARAIRAGIVDLVPTLGINLVHDDNIFRREDDAQSSYMWVITPSILARVQNDNNLYSLQFDVIDGTFDDSPDDNYTDWRVSATAQLGLNARNAMELRAGYFSSREFRGREFSEGDILPEAPIGFSEENYALDYQFGAEGARGQLSFNLNYVTRSYEDSPERTFQEDTDLYNFTSTFSYNAFARTSLLLEYRHVVREFQTAFVQLFANRDSTDNYIFVGVGWQPESRLSGTVLLGYGDRKYDSPEWEDVDIPSWDVNLRWQMRSYSALVLSANSTFAESFLVGSGAEGTDYSIGWEHDWSDRLSSNLNFRWADSDFGDDLRQDNVKGISLDIGYAFRRWLNFTFSVNDEERESNVAGLFSYSQRTIALGIQASL